MRREPPVIHLFRSPSQLNRFGILGLCFMLALPCAVLGSFDASAAAPEEGPGSGGGATTGAAAAEPKPGLDVSWQDRLLTLDVVGRDVREVVQAISEKTGVAIEIYEGVTGKVTLHLERAPLEKVVDTLLASVGQRNYLMVFDGGGLTKMSIVPKGCDGAGLGDAAKRVKAKGRLKNGKEIEYFPGEIVVGVDSLAHRRGLLEDVTRALESKYGLDLLKSTKVGLHYALKFRILGGRNVIAVMYDILDGHDEYVTYVTPNGIGENSVEMPEEDFHVYDATLTREEEETRKAQRLNVYQAKMATKPFLRMALFPGGSEETPYVEGEFSIQIGREDRPRLSYDDVLFLANNSSSIVISSSRDAEGHFEHAILFSPGLSSDGEYQAKLEELRHYIHPIRQSEYTNAFPHAWVVVNGIPNDDKYTQKLQWNITRVRAENAWDLISGSNSVSVAVPDTGLYREHLDIRDAVWSNQSEIPGNGIDDDANDYTDDVGGWDYLSRSGALSDHDDGLGHGTHVAGIFGALTNNNREGIAGVVGNGFPAIRARILPLAIDFRNLDMIRQAIQYATRYARVINMSWDWRFQPELAQDIADAYNAGVVIVGAAGNAKRQVDSLTDWPSASLGQILVVAGLDVADHLYVDDTDSSIGSNWGAIVDVCAPGKNIVSTVADGDYGSMSGTSMASPHVAGLAALLLSQGKTRDQVYGLIAATADPLSGSGMGTGRINMYSALRGSRDAAPPSKPTDSRLLRHPNDFRLTWSPSTDNDAIEGYAVLRREFSGVLCPWPVTVAGESYCQLARVFPDGTNDAAGYGSSYTSGTYTFVDDTTSAGEYYAYRLVAYDKTGNPSEPTNEMTTVPPGVPTELYAKGGNARAKITWTAPTMHEDGTVLTDLAGYRVYCSTGVDPRVGSMVEVDASTESKELTGLVNNTAHFVCVTAFDSVGNESACSDVVSVTPRDWRWVHAAGGPSGSYASITDALSGAPPETKVIVGPGTYEIDGVLSIGGDSGTDWNPVDIWLVSERGPGETTIIANSITVSDKTRVVGFTIRDASYRAVEIFFDEGVLIANNIFLSNEVGVFSGGSDSGLATQMINRIYNNVFAGNVTGIETYFSYVFLDIRNNIFQGTDTSHTAVGMSLATDDVMVKYNIFHGPGSAEPISRDDRNVEVGSNYTCDPAFVAFSPFDLAGSDYHLWPGSSCAIDSGTIGLKYEGEDWIDCVASGGNGRRADLGAYGGPFAHVDKNGNGISDCDEPAGYPSTAVVLNDGIDRPISLTARDQDSGNLTFAVATAPLHGNVSGAPPNLAYRVSGYAGQEALTYTVSNPVGTSDPETVSITVKDSNSPPVAHDLSAEVRTIDSRYVFTLEATDPDGDPLTYTVEPEVQGGSVVCLELPRCYFFPGGATPPYTATFTYSASDGLAQSAPATVTVTVANSVPIIQDPHPSETEVHVSENSSVYFSAVAYDPDVAHGQVLVYRWTVDGNDVGTEPDFRFVPNHTSDPGTTQGIEVTITDGLAVVSRSWTVTTHWAPVIEGGSPAIGYVELLEGVSQVFTVVVSDADTPAEGLHYTWTDGRADVGGDSYRLSAGVAAPGNRYFLRVTVSDGLWSVSREWSIVILPNSPPSIVLEPIEGATNAPAFDISWTDADPDSSAEIALYASRDSGPWELLATGISEDAPVNEYVWDISAAPEGSYELRAVIADEWSTVAVTAVGSLRIDRTAPAVTADPLLDPLVNSTSTVLAGTREAEASISLAADRATQIGPVSYPSATTWSCAVDGLTAGPISFTATARDAAGNTATAVATTNIVFDLPPVILDFHPGNLTVETPVDGSEPFSVTASDPDGDAAELTYTWYLAGAQVGTGNFFVFNPTAAMADNIPRALTVVVADQHGSAEQTWSVTASPYVIVDDGACVFDGTWSVSSAGSGFLGGGFRIHVAGTGVGYATCSVTVPSPGAYQVFARWPASGTYDADAVYRVTYAGGVRDDVRLDQTTDGGRWNLLGTYQFDGAGEVRLQTGNNDLGVMDAVRLVATTEPADVIVDDPSGTSAGVWDLQSGGYHGTYRIAAAVGTEAAADRTVTWLPGAMVPGTWELQARWTVVSGGASDAKYIVSTGGTESLQSQVTVDQTSAGGQWVRLGMFSFLAGDSPFVTLGNNAGGQVVADAIKLAYRSPEASSMVDNEADANLLAATGGAEDRFGWTGTWAPKKDVPGFVGSTYRQIAGVVDPQERAMWILPVEVAGTYEIYARWTSGTDRTAAARYEIWRGVQVDPGTGAVPDETAAQVDPSVVTLNQQADGGRWNYLGRFHLEAESAQKTAVVLKQSSDGLVVADAVMILKTDEELPIIVDDADPSCSMVAGTWHSPSAPVDGFWGSGYRQIKPESANSGARVAWQPQLPTAGNYDVFARWTAGTDRTTAARYGVHNGAGESILVSRDQTKNGGVWVSLGRHFQRAGETQVDLEAVDTARTVADAVRFDYSVLSPPVVIDNDNVNNEIGQACHNEGVWPTGTAFVDSYSAGEGAVLNYLVRSSGEAGVIQWRPSLTLRGYYAVHAWWPTPAQPANYASQAPFKIIHVGAPDGEVRKVSQQSGGGKWNYLGTYLFDAGENGAGGYVELSAATSGKVLADAVKFTPEGR